MKIYPLLFAILSTPALAVDKINLQTVRIDNLNNPADSTGYGSVPYGYSIGSTEVSNLEYTAFLNSADPNGTNPTGIYSSSMGSDAVNGGITFTSGATAGSKYTSKLGFANKPVSYVNFLDAMRFANWLNSDQNGSATESGAYLLSAGGLAVRNLAATVFVASENEWYKAAYYDPTTGAGGGDNYWRYPTQSDSAPGASTPNGLANQANYNSVVNAVTIGAAYSSSSSYYGTFDQGGNVYEWNDAVIGTGRGLRGGAYNFGPNPMLATSRNSNNPFVESVDTGFRITTIPEPSALLSLLLSTPLLLARRPRSQVLG